MVTQQERQDAFDSQETTDDHGMHVTGLVKDQNGTKYFKVKNSWELNITSVMDIFLCFISLCEISKQ